ncbi:MAG TPA: hypothetical protein VIU11_21180, partial [Nakamurella sp.]
DELTALVRVRDRAPQVLTADGSWVPYTGGPVEMRYLTRELAIDLAEAVLAGASRLVLRPVMPRAFLPPSPCQPVLAAVDLTKEPAETEKPAGGDASPGDGWNYYVIVDELDTGAVLDVFRLKPGPKLERYDGTAWTADPKMLADLQGVTPPPIVEITDPELFAQVYEQVQTSYAEEAGEGKGKESEESEAETAAAGPMNAEKLRRYWSIGGKGGAKIRWGTGSDFTRCVKYLRKYLGGRAKGYCANMHKRNTGMWPGDKRNRVGSGPPAPELALLSSIRTGTWIPEDGKATDMLADGIYTERIQDVLVASLLAGGFPMEPPTEWFEDPKLASATPITVDDDGRVYGHLADWETAHIGLPGETHAPKSRSDYAFFKTGVLRTAGGGDVNVGQLTLVGGHAPLSADARTAVQHYDDTASAVADVTIGEDRHGIWVAGAMRPEVTPAQVRAFRASALSGDWRPIKGNLELVAACAVNVPGFPIARARVAGGQVLAMVATGARRLYLKQISLMSDAALAERVDALESLLADIGVAPEGSTVSTTPALPPAVVTDTTNVAKLTPLDPGEKPPEGQGINRDKVRARVKEIRRDRLRERVHQGAMAASGGGRSRATGLTAAYLEWQHPRGIGGKWIEKFGAVDILDRNGGGKGRRGTIADLTEAGPVVEYPGGDAETIPLSDAARRIRVAPQARGALPPNAPPQATPNAPTPQAAPPMPTPVPPSPPGAKTPDEVPAHLADLYHHYRATDGYSPMAVLTGNELGLGEMLVVKQLDGGWAYVHPGDAYTPAGTLGSYVDASTSKMIPIDEKPPPGLTPELTGLYEQYRATDPDSELAVLPGNELGLGEMLVVKTPDGGWAYVHPGDAHTPAGTPGSYVISPGDLGEERLTSIDDGRGGRPHGLPKSLQALYEERRAQDGYSKMAVLKGNTYGRGDELVVQQPDGGWIYVHPGDAHTPAGDLGSYVISPGDPGEERLTPIKDVPGSRVGLGGIYASAARTALRSRVHGAVAGGGTPDFPEGPSRVALRAGADTAKHERKGIGGYPIKSVQALKDAISAFGRAKPADRAATRAHIISEAKRLKHTELIPDGWTAGGAVAASGRQELRDRVHGTPDDGMTAGLFKRDTFNKRFEFREWQHPRGADGEFVNAGGKINIRSSKKRDDWQRAEVAELTSKGPRIRYPDGTEKVVPIDKVKDLIKAAPEEKARLEKREEDRFQREVDTARSFRVAENAPNASDEEIHRNIAAKHPDIPENLRQAGIERWRGVVERRKREEKEGRRGTTAYRSDPTYGSAVVASARQALRDRVHGALLARGGKYLEWQHPRGRNGTWIEKLGLVNVFDKDGRGKPRRAKVVDITPDGPVVEYSGGGGRETVPLDKANTRILGAPKPRAQLKSGEKLGAPPEPTAADSLDEPTRRAQVEAGRVDKKGEPLPVIERGDDGKIVVSDEAKRLGSEVYNRGVAAEPEISAALARMVGDQDPANYTEPGAGEGKLFGYKYRLKAEYGVQEKVERNVEEDKLQREQAAANIKDAVRYTVHFPQEEFGERSQAVIDQLVAENPKVVVKNTWPPEAGRAYKGINVNVFREDGTAYEVQFHTPESQRVKDKMHGLYEDQRKTVHGSPEWQAIEDQMNDMGAELVRSNAPAGVMDIKVRERPPSGGEGLFDEGPVTPAKPAAPARPPGLPEAVPFTGGRVVESKNMYNHAEPRQYAVQNGDGWDVYDPDGKLVRRRPGLEFDTNTHKVTDLNKVDREAPISDAPRPAGLPEAVPYNGGRASTIKNKYNNKMEYAIRKGDGRWDIYDQSGKLVGQPGHPSLKYDDLLYDVKSLMPAA